MIRETVQAIPYTLPTGTDQVIVNVTLTGQTIYYGETYRGSADKTAAQIYAAYQAGKDVYALVNEQYIPFVKGNSGHGQFTIIRETSSKYYEIGLLVMEDQDGDIWTYEAKQSAIENESGSLDYTDLANKPKIEGVTLEGDQSFSQLNLSKLTNSELENMLV